MAEAIKLTRDNLTTIADKADEPLGVFEDALDDAYDNGETRFVIFNITAQGHHYRWLTATEEEFFEEYDFVDPTRSNKICLA